jgi:HAD superfamily hydrolase (TIGR01509 family)
MSAILFDMDGTLINSEPLWLQAEIEIMAELGCHWDQQDQINCLGGPMERTEKYMQQRSNNVKPYGYFERKLDELMEYKLSNELELIPNARELLEDCKASGIKIALVTASNGRQMRSVLSRFPKGFFDAAVSRDDVEKSKPDPAPYLFAANLLGVKNEFCVVFEDSPTGVLSGLRSGAQVIGIPHLTQIEPHVNLRLIGAIADINLDQLISWYPFLASRLNSND